MSENNIRMGRGPIVPGKAGLIMLAAAAVPILVTAFKPLAKAVGKGLIAAGEALKQAADEPEKPVEKAEPKAQKESVADVPKSKATATSAAAPSVKVATKVKQSKPKKASASKASKKLKAKKPQVAAEPAEQPVGASPRRRRSIPSDIETG